MHFSEMLSQPGEHPFTLTGANAGIRLEALFTLPKPITREPRACAVICHPHPLMQGTMRNKVVTTLCKAYAALDIPSIRFQFRGVGNSSGQFDHGVGEGEDLKSILSQIQSVWPTTLCFLAGFSFGAYVVFRVSRAVKVRHVVLIAPPVHRFDFDLAPFDDDPAQKPAAPERPYLLVQGQDDDVVPFSQVKHWADTQLKGHVEWVAFEKTGHFFHGQLTRLKTTIVQLVP